MPAHNTIEFGSASWKHGFTMVPNHVLDAAHLTGNAKLTFALLMRYGRAKERAYPGQKRMASAVGCTEKTLRVYIDELTGIGLVEVRRRGRGQTNLYVLHPDRELLPIKNGNDDPSGSVTITGKEEQGEEEQEEVKDGAAAPERADEESDDPAQKLYDTYLRLVKGKDSEPLPPSIRRAADKALREFPDPADLERAIVGFLNWRKKKDGDRRFSSIFATHPGGRPLHDHIDFWISQAGETSPLDGLPSETKVKITRAVREVQRAFGTKDPDQQATGEQALEYLKSKGIEPAHRPDGSPYFPSLGAKP